MSHPPEPGQALHVQQTIGRWLEGGWKVTERWWEMVMRQCSRKPLPKTWKKRY